MEKIASAIAECRRLGIKVLPPDINRSRASFAIEASPSTHSPVNGEGNGEAAIRFGLASIKNVGSSPIEQILSGRDSGGDFESIEDFSYRTDLSNINKKVLESLIKVGVFDSLGSRKTLLESLNKIISASQTKQRAKESGQVSMFDLWGQTSPTAKANHSQGEEEVSPRQKAMWERELLGVYFSQLLDFLSREASSPGSVSCGEIDR